MELIEKSSKIGTLTYNLEDPHAREEMMMAIDVLSYKICIDELWNNVWRPSRKHGYPDKRIEDLLEELGDKGYALIELLIEIHNQTIKDNLSHD